jgi:hypothetical protein
VNYRRKYANNFFSCFPQVVLDRIDSIETSSCVVATLTVNVTPIHNEAANFLTSTYDNFIQTAGIRDGASYCAKILSVFYDNLDASDPNDPDVIIKIDVSNAFNTTDRVFTLDMISGRASRDYACGFKR